MDRSTPSPRSPWCTIDGRRALLLSRFARYGQEWASFLYPDEVEQALAGNLFRSHVVLASALSIDPDCLPQKAPMAGSGSSVATIYSTMVGRASPAT